MIPASKFGFISFAQASIAPGIVSGAIVAPLRTPRSSLLKSSAKHNQHRARMLRERKWQNLMIMTVGMISA
jgi:hypothetical protein